MRKIVFIFILAAILASGCAVSRKTGSNVRPLLSRDGGTILELANNQNITNSSFFIEKGRISTTGESGRIRLLFTMKYKQPGIYLISLKSITGTEAFRVYLTRDTVLINDRINKITYAGKPFDFERITGLPAALLKLSVGDFFSQKEKEKKVMECVEGKLIVEDYYQGLKIESIMDCGIGKTKKVTIASGLPNELISILYSKHDNDFYKIPGKVELNDFRRNVKIVIKIEKKSVPWNGDIEFVPGREYIRKRL